MATCRSIVLVILAWVCAGACGQPSAAAAPPQVNPSTSKLTLAIGARSGALLPPIDSNGPSAFDAEGNQWFIQAVGGTVASTPWRVYKGKNLDDLKFQYEFVADKRWLRPHGDDTWWAEGLWIDPADGRWYAVLHTEFNYNKYSRHPGTGYSIDRMSSVALATSVDQGRTWTFRGDIISSDHSDKPEFWSDRNYWRQGPGDPALYVDGKYFYVYYNSRWNSRDDINAIYAGVRVARCPLSAKLAAGCWKKWYLGKWQSPGLGGHDSDVFNNNYSDTATIFWSQPHRLYVAVTLCNYRLNASGQDEYDGCIATATSLAKQDWSGSIVAVDAGHKGWYSWAVDPLSWSRYELQTTRLRWCAGKFGSYNGVAGYPCFAARLVDAPVNAEAIAPRYPPESVEDFSPGWDRVHFPRSAAPPSR